jgi:hypothetical protein
VEFLDGNIAVERAQVFTEGEESVVSSKHLNHAFVALGDFYLGSKRVGLDVDAAFAREGAPREFPARQ